MSQRFQFSLIGLAAILLLGFGFFTGTVWQHRRDMQAFEQRQRLSQEFERKLKWALDMALGSDEKKPDE
jgi:hypothetical protein